jgi:hypothetical protein
MTGLHWGGSPHLCRLKASLTTKNVGLLPGFLVSSWSVGMGLYLISRFLMRSTAAG